MTDQGRTVPPKGSVRFHKYFDGIIDADLVDSKHYYTVASESEMLALSPPLGSQCYRTDTKELYIYVGP